MVSKDLNITKVPNDYPELERKIDGNFDGLRRKSRDED